MMLLIVCPNLLSLKECTCLLCNESELIYANIPPKLWNYLLKDIAMD